jgi:hypothetical protein
LRVKIFRLNLNYSAVIPALNIEIHNDKILIA